MGILQLLRQVNTAKHRRLLRPCTSANFEPLGRNSSATRGGASQRSSSAAQLCYMRLASH
jgi:hypothetical protein